MESGGKWSLVQMELAEWASQATPLRQVLQEEFKDAFGALRALRDYGAWVEDGVGVVFQEGVVVLGGEDAAADYLYLDVLAVAVFQFGDATTSWGMQFLGRTARGGDVDGESLSCMNARWRTVFKCHAHARFPRLVSCVTVSGGRHRQGI